MSKEIVDRMQGIARKVDAAIPPKHGFVVLVFEFGGPGKELHYVSNSDRADIIAAMKEWIRLAGTPENFAKHLDKNNG